MWFAFGIHSAENYWRCVVYGRVLAMCTFIFGKVMLDAILSSWQAAILDGVITCVALVSCLALLVLVIPIAKVCVYFQRRNLTVTEFVEKRKKELRKFFNLPLVYSIVMMLSYIFIFLSDDITKTVWDYYHAWPAVRTVSLLAIPVLLPIAYYAVRETTHRAENWLEQMSKKSDKVSDRSLKE